MGKKHFSDYQQHSRKIVQSYIQQSKHKKKANNAGAWDVFRFWLFSNLEMVIGLCYYIGYLLSSKPIFRIYTNSHQGIFSIEQENFTVGLLSDWASATDVSEKVARQLAEKNCAVTIHMGDIYYVGHKEEVLDNFCKERGDWCYGTMGSLAIPGNHEYFSNGSGFYDVLLPLMGIQNENQFLAQESGYFCLENQYWRVIGLDTGYHSVKDSVIKLTLWQDAHLDEKMIQWLKEKVCIESDNRGIILLTHHQPKSAFEDTYPIIAKQLIDIIGTKRPILWIWGHEHRLAFYGVHAKKDQLTAFGRCIGHGGMPVVIGKNGKLFPPKNMDAEQQTLIAFDERVNAGYEDDFKLSSKMLGFNGFATLEFQQEQLSINYFTVNNSEALITEKWEVDLTNGQLKGSIKENIPGTLTLYNNESLENAVRIQVDK
jgi:hypothetical protein